MVPAVEAAAGSGRYRTAINQAPEQSAEERFRGFRKNPYNRQCRVSRPSALLSASPSTTMVEANGYITGSFENVDVGRVRAQEHFRAYCGAA